MEEDLAWLKLLLIKHNGIDLVVAIEKTAREEMPPLDMRGELELVFNELEAVLVHSFKAVAHTMSRLKAETLIICADPSTDGREDSGFIGAAPDRTDRIAISQDSLGTWGEVAAEATAILREMRQRYDFA